MSARLLQKAASTAASASAGGGAGGGGASRGRGRGRGRSMSLMEFHDQVGGGGSSSSTGDGRSSRPLAWGRGDAASAAGPNASEPGPGGVRNAWTRGRGGGQRRPDSDAWQSGPPEPQANAWGRGPPTSAVDALWEAPVLAAPTVADAAWDEPVEVPHDAGDWGYTDASPSLEVDGWNTADASGLQARDDANAADAGYPASSPSTAWPLDDAAAPVEGDDISKDVVAWLKELNLLDHKEAVLAWCEEMGAASLEEVVDSSDELAQAVKFKALQAKRLQNRAAEALAAVRSRGGLDGGGGARGADVPTAEAMDAPAAKQPQSFYGASASAEVVVQRRWAPGKSYASTSDAASNSREAPIEESSGDEGGDGVYLKQRPTQTATWTPALKVGQGARKRQQKQVEATQGGVVVAAAEAGEADESGRRREEAARRLQQQIEEEASRKKNAARKIRDDALERSDPDALQQAITEAEAAGLPASEITEWQLSFKKMVLRRRQRCENAVCALQVVLEAPRGKSFKTQALKALETATDAREAAGGARAEQDVLAALREWEVAEQRREEAALALHLAIRRGDASALQVALDEAREAGLGQDEDLFVEAQRELHDAQEREALDKAAGERLRKAVEVENLQLLEAAVEECAARQLPLHDADALLLRLQSEARHRDEFCACLQAALDSEDPVAIRAEVARAGRVVGLDPSVLEKAEARAREIDVEAKRRRNAEVELHLACSSGDVERLEAAVAEARRWRVDEEAIVAADSALHEAREMEVRRKAARYELEDAMRHRDISRLRVALEAADAVLGRGDSELDRARLLVKQLEEKARQEEIARAKADAEASLRLAEKRGDWESIEDSRRRLLELGVDETDDVIRFADAALEALRAAREVHEARRLIEATEARLRELSAREATLTGAAHKKERVAIGKEIMALKGDDEYLSAFRFIRNPNEERRRREERRLQAEKRKVEAAEELEAAVAQRDEAKVVALVAEGSLGADDMEAARHFLVEQENRREAADRDASVLEFVYAGLDRRTFFQAQVAMNELFAEKYRMQEGSDFKLKVVKASNSVLVAFRSAEFARAVAATAKRFASENGSTIVALAEVVGAMDMSPVAQESLPSLRQDTENLQRKPARPEAERAVREAMGCGPCFERTTTAPPQREPGRTAARDAASLDRATTYPPADTGGAEARSRPAAQRRGATHTVASTKNEDVIPLPRWASERLQRDREKATTFRNDLRVFAGKFRVSVDLQGLDSLVMKPNGLVHQEALRQARVELQGLLDYHFPDRRNTTAPAPRPPERRRASLRVDAEKGACIEMTPTLQGYRVDHVDDYPGQDFTVGELIVEINGRSLVGLSEEDLEDTFAECFAHGASLLLTWGDADA